MFENKLERVKAYIALGSNLGDKIENLKSAVCMLEENSSCLVVKKSSLYITKPVGIEDQPEFLNAVVELETSLNPNDLLELCLNIEKRLGRKRTIRWGPRVIDLDILLYDNLTVCEENLKIPHPEMMKRAFVLVPLAEIAPDVILPGGIKALDASSRLEKKGVEFFRDSRWD